MLYLHCIAAKVGMRIHSRCTARFGVLCLYKKLIRKLTAQLHGVQVPEATLRAATAVVAGVQQHTHTQ